MIIRCDVHDSFDVREIHRCLEIAGFLSRIGHRVAWAVPKTGYERIRAMLPDDAQSFRLPLREPDELDRLTHLHRKHEFRTILVNRHQASSSFLFHLNRVFQQTIVLDHGGIKGMIYASMLINPDPAAPNHRYDCHPAARLFLGPKFFLCDPKPVTPPVLDEVSHMLLDLGDEVAPTLRILNVLAGMQDLPVVHVLCGAKAPIAVAMRTLEEACPNLDAHPVLRQTGKRFPYEHYPVIVTRAQMHCLDLAHAGQFFLTLATARQEVELAYTLSQKGAAPTLGWLASKEDQDIADAVKHCLMRPEMRIKHSRSAMRYVDGQGLARIAHLIVKD